MKAVVFCCIMGVMALNADAQSKVNLPMSSDSTILYTEVVKVDSNIKKDQLYSQAKEWFVNTFTSAKAVIQSDDETNGRIIGKFTEPGETGIAPAEAIGNECYINVEIDVKNGRYRYKFYNFGGDYTILGVTGSVNTSQMYLKYLHGDFPKGAFMSKRGLYETLDRVYTKFNVAMASIISSLNSYMQSVKSDNF